MPRPGGEAPRSPRWQEDGLSVSFRSCQLVSLAPIAGTLTSQGRDPAEVNHLDLGENELTSLEKLGTFDRLLSLDVSHNSIDALPAPALPPTLLHLNVAYNRLEGAGGVGSLSRLIELNLSYNLLTSCQAFEPMTQLQVLLLGGNRIASLIGLEPLTRLEVLDLRFNYVEKPAELRLLGVNATLRALTLQGNPVAKHPSYRAMVGSTLPALLSLDSSKMPRSSAQRQGSGTSNPATLGAQTAFSGGAATAVTRPASRKPVRTHTRYGAAEPKASAPTLALLSSQGPAPVAHGGLGAPPSSRRGGAPALNASLLRSASGPSMQFAPAGSTLLAAGPGGAAATPRFEAGATPASARLGRMTDAAMRPSVPPTASALSAREAAAVNPPTGALMGRALSGAGSTRRKLLVGSEQKHAVAAAVASKEAAAALRSTLQSARHGLQMSREHAVLETPTLAALAALSSGEVDLAGGGEAPTVSQHVALAQHRLGAPMPHTPVHRAPVAYQHGSAPPAPASAATTLSAAAAASTVARSGQERQAGASAVGPGTFLRRGSGLGGGGATGVVAPTPRPMLNRAPTSGSSRRLDGSTDRQGLVRSLSAEALRPGVIKAASTLGVPTDLIKHLSPPLLRQNTSRLAAGAATERAPTSAASAAAGLMELAFEVGCAIKVQRGVFVPTESPGTLLESLLKMQAS